MAGFRPFLLHLALICVVSGSCEFISPDNSLRSGETGKDVEIQFSNPGDGEFDIFWIDRSSQEVEMGMLMPRSELGYITNEGMAWRIKLHGTSLVVLEYVIDHPLREPLILNEDLLPILALTVGKGCSNNDKDSFNSKGKKDSLRLFRSDLKRFPTKRRSSLSNNLNRDVLDEVVQVEVSASSDSVISDSMDSQPEAEADVEVQQETRKCAHTEQWLNKHLGVEGYHVICVTKPPHHADLAHPHNPGISYEVQAWQEGYMNIPNDQTYHASTFAEFRAQLEEIFAIERTDAWRVESVEAIRQDNLPQDGSTKWAFLPQKWRLFDVHRQPVESLHAIEDEQLLLLFEGGQFIFPGVDMGFERVVSSEGSEYLLKTLSMRPLLLQVDDLLRDDECAYMIDYSAPKMVPSGVSLMDKDKGKAATNFRTSEYVFMDTKSHAVLQTIDQRIANITGLNIKHQEDAQILKYEVGNYYLSHNDYWSPSYYQSKDMIKMTRGGHKNRMATVFWYMNSDVEGGCTSFTHAPVHNAFASQTMPSTISSNSKQTQQKSEESAVLAALASSDPKVKEMVDCDYGLKVAPKKGRAIIFYSLLPSGNGDDYSEHAACAVTSGTKWAANKWIWNQVRWES